MAIDSLLAAYTKNAGRLLHWGARRGGDHKNPITIWCLVAPRVGVGRVKVYESHGRYGCGAGGDQSDCEKKGLEHVSAPVLVAG